MKDKDKFLVVTTAHRGVFSGYGQVTTDKIMRLTQVRMCVSWSSSIKGVVGLSTTGPDAQCRIGPAAPAVTLQDITAIMETTPEAEAAWNQQPWS